VEPLLVYLVVGNLVTFALFGIDKHKARDGSRRIPEATLIGASALTGTIGGWLGMRHFRHKTAKRSFQAKMVAATALDLVVLLLAAKHLL
jgi:uncharacterized membrane protein YsdA (DUF1294 family)